MGNDAEVDQSQRARLDLRVPVHDDHCVLPKVDPGQVRAGETGPGGVPAVGDWTVGTASPVDRGPQPARPCGAAQLVAACTVAGTAHSDGRTLDGLRQVGPPRAVLRSTELRIATFPEVDTGP